jgi:hypothetical protein
MSKMRNQHLMQNVKPSRLLNISSRVALVVSIAGWLGIVLALVAR